MSNIRTESAISSSLPTAAQTLLADITASSVWSETNLQYYLGNSTTLGFDSEFRDTYDGSPSDYFTDGSLPDATFAFVTQMERDFRMIDSVIATDFTRVTSATTAQAQADIVLVSSSHLDEPYLEGFCMFPGSATRASGDYWSLGAFNSTPGFIDDAPELGGGEYLNWTLIHEVGHGLGLLHPFDYWGTLDSVGAAMDNERYTVMSYTGSTSGAYTYGHAVTMMALDIAALQQQYGAETYAAGNSSYTLLDARGGALSLTEGDVQIGRAYYCIWDSGGIDTIDYGNVNNSVLINLNDATLDRSRVAADAAPAIAALQSTAYYTSLSADLRTETVNPDYHAGGFFSRVLTHDSTGYTGIDGGFSIAHGAVIENATGGGHDDLLIGNEQANRLTGNAGNDVLIGAAGNDTVNGGLGNDTMLGGAGNDAYFVNAAGDRVFETTTMATTVNAGGIDTVSSSVTLNLDAYAGVRFVERLTLTGTAAINGTGNALANVLTGNAGTNQLSGGLGNDTINGGLGADVLTTGAGSDVIVFSTALGAGNIDRITDFSVPFDTIRLENAVFTGLTAGALAASAFASNLTGMAADALDRILYESDTGRLYFDADGTEAGARVQFATLAANLSLTQADFLII